MGNFVETLAGTRPAPAIVIRLPIESKPVVYMDAASEGEERRLNDWLLSNGPLADLVTDALELRAA